MIVVTREEIPSSNFVSQQERERERERETERKEFNCVFQKSVVFAKNSQQTAYPLIQKQLKQLELFILEVIGKFGDDEFS